MKALSVLLLAFTLGSLPIHAAGLKFSPELNGHYRGTLTYSSGGLAPTGSDFNVVVTVPKNGRQAKIAIDGFATVSQGPTTISYAFLGNLKIAPNRTVTADNALLAFYFQIPATGRALGKKKLSYTLISNDPTVGNVTMTYTLSLQGKKLVILGSGTAGGAPTSVSLIAKRRGP
jgi:hypothetical protein